MAQPRSGRRAGLAAVRLALAAALSVALSVAFALEARCGAARHPSLARPPWSRSLEGAWTNASLTKLERPPELSAPTVTAAEARVFAAKRRNGFPLNWTDEVGGVDSEWWEPGERLARIDGKYRTAWIVDPADGRLPFTPAGRREAETRQRLYRDNFDGPEARPTTERCLTGVGAPAGPPMLNANYNTNYRIVQTRDHVAILVEMNHDVRIIPLDRRPHVPGSMPQWMGDAVGHWEGDSLVVETRNFHPDEGLRSPARLYLSSTARVTERFTRISETEILYAFTVEDPATYASPWRARMLFQKSREPMFEYACHEGNYSLAGALAGARRAERTAQASAAEAGEPSVRGASAR